MNQSGSGWPTYTVGYGAAYDDDELVDGSDTARILGSKHSSVMITKATFQEALPKIASCVEEPTADASIVPMYFVCERARHDVKVALVGQGPDELFGGYVRHLGVRYGKAWARLPRWMRSATSSAVLALPRNEALKRGVQCLAIPDRKLRYQNVLSLLPGTQVDELFEEGILGPDFDDCLLESWDEVGDLMECTDELGGLQFLELRSTLPDELLMNADKLSMAHGLELRVPYVDKEIVEYVERLPANLKVRNGSRKWLHRQVCQAYLPHPILQRPKRGFAVDVVDDWFRNAIDGKMADALRDSSSRMYSYLRPSRVLKLVNQHASGREDNHKILFSLVLLEEWLRAHEEPVATA